MSWDENVLIEWWDLSLSHMVCLQSATPREGSYLLDAEVGRAVSHHLPFRQKDGCHQLHIKKEEKKAKVHL